MSTANLKVLIRHLRSSQGLVRIALYNSPNSHLKPGQEFRAGAFEIDNDLCRAEFLDLPEGTYSLAAFHDENNNRRLDVNIIGIPREGFAFSNNVKPLVGNPRFDQTCFAFTGAGLDMDIVMLYL